MNIDIPGKTVDELDECLAPVAGDKLYILTNGDTDDQFLDYNTLKTDVLSTVSADASDITVTPVGGIASTDVQAALAELDSEKAASSHNHSGVYDPAGTAASEVATHTGDTIDAHDAAAISVAAPLDATLGANVQLALDYINTGLVTLSGNQSTTAGDLSDHISDTVDAHDASAISNVPNGNIVATTVQAAIDELDTEKAALAGADFTGDVSVTGTFEVVIGDTTLNGTAEVLDTVTVTPSATTNRNLVLETITSQTANAIEVLSNGQPLFQVSPIGYMACLGMTSSNTITATPLFNSITPLIVRGISGQTGALQVWQNDTPTTLSSVDAGGRFRVPSGTVGTATGSVMGFSDTNTGVNFTGSDVIELFTGGTTRAQIDSTGVSITGKATQTGTPSASDDLVTLGYLNGELNEVWGHPATLPASYWVLNGGIRATATIPSEAVLYFTPVWLPSGTLDRIGVHVTVVGSTGAVVRLGVYNADSVGAVGTLLVDGGTVDATASTGTGFKTVSISQAITSGKYYIAVVVQGSASTRPTLRWTTAQTYYQGPNIGLTNPPDTSNAYGAPMIQSSVSGALPNPGVEATVATNGPTCGVRYSS